MSDINLVVLSGNVGKEPEIKEVAGSELATFSIAVNVWKGATKGEETMWVYLNMWGGMAKLAEYIHVGDRVTVTGQLNIRKVDTKTYVDVTVRDIVLPPKRDDTGTRPAQRDAEDESPKARPRRPRRPQATATKPDDDLPF